MYTYGNIPEGEDDDTERNDIFATFLNKTILGVNAHVVRDTAYENGVLVEDTLDYYAQDKEGNVWYFGEDVLNYRYDDDGNYLSTDQRRSLAREQCHRLSWLHHAHARNSRSA